MLRRLGEAAGFFKSPLGPSDSQIRAHKEQKEELAAWQHDLNQLVAVLSRLSVTYSQHKGDFALGRYEEVKRMIKTAVEDCQKVVKEQKERLNAAGGQRSKREKKLHLGASNFKDSAECLCKDGKLYSEMSDSELNDDMVRMRREVLQLKQDFRRERDKLQKLRTDYEESKNVNPAQRYMELKELIKTLVSETAVKN